MIIAVKKSLLYYLPAILWAGLIFYLSSIAGLKVGAESFYWEVLLRKLAHVSEYIILAWLIWRIFHYCHGAGSLRSFLFSAFSVLFFAMGDELHQAFVQERSGRLIDVAIDALSAVSFLSFLIAIKKPDSECSRSKHNAGRLGWLLLGTILMVVAVIIIFSLSNQAKLKQERRNNNPEQESNQFIKELENSRGSVNDNPTKKETAGQAVGGDGRQGVPPSGQPAKDEKDKMNLMPDSILAKVPFTSQAPYANWDDVHEEACEEASLIMVRYYLAGETLTKDSAEREIQKMKNFQVDNYGTYKDSNMQQLVELARGFYGLENLEVSYDFSKEEIKRQLSKGKILILPTAGRKLKNPNFTPPGPLYHNLVAIGYEGDKIITNDPGTKNGEKYVYDIDVLYGAIHDFPGNKEEIEKGRKAMIVVSHKSTN